MAQTKHCARCGTAFGCGRQDPECWCSALPPLPASAERRPGLDDTFVIDGGYTAF